MTRKLMSNWRSRRAVCREAADLIARHGWDAWALMNERMDRATDAERPFLRMVRVAIEQQEGCRMPWDWSDGVPDRPVG